MSELGRRPDPGGPSDIRWPAGVTPRAADLFAHGEVFIDGRTSAIWRHLVEAAAWPTWYPDALEVSILPGDESVLRPGCAFILRTGLVRVDAVVDEFVPYSRLGWVGRGPGLDTHRRWVLRTVGRGCRVVTEEFVNGPGVAAIAGALAASQDLWLVSLKNLSEQGR